MTRTYNSGSGFAYWSQFKYVCDDPREFIKLSSEPDTSLLAQKYSRCMWRKAYEVNGKDLVCIIHHCQHPHNDPGKHDPPPSENQINLVQRNNWHIAFGSSITYRCATNTYIENDESDPTQTQIQVVFISYISL